MSVRESMPPIRTAIWRHFAVGLKLWDLFHRNISIGITMTEMKDSAASTPRMFLFY